MYRDSLRAWDETTRSKVETFLPIPRRVHHTGAMKNSHFSQVTLPIALTAAFVLGGCSKQAPQQQAETAQQPAPTAQTGQPQQAMPPAPPTEQAPVQQQAPLQREAPARQRAFAPPPERQAPEPASFTIPAGTEIRVTTSEELGSKISQSGQSFSASVADPIAVRGVTLVRSGSSASGTVIDAKSLGRFKGQAELALRLNTIRSDGRSYQVESSSIVRVEKGKGKRTAIMAGGGGGLGALIGGLAGGGKGALIGGLVGAGAGTGGAAFTGNKEIVIPAETTLTFRLEHSVTVSR